MTALTEVPRRVKPIEMEGLIVVVRGPVGGQQELVCDGYTVSVWGDKAFWTWILMTIF